MPLMRGMGRRSTAARAIRSIWIFTRNRSAVEKQEYHNIKGHTAMAEFRRQWREAQVTNVRATKKNSQEEKRTEGTKGMYMPRSVMVKKEGGDRDAEIATDNIIRKCLTRGVPVPTTGGPVEGEQLVVRGARADVSIVVHHRL